MTEFTTKQAISLARDLDCTLTFNGDDYCVNVGGGNEDTAYYTNSQSDALDQCEEWADDIEPIELLIG